MRNILIDLTLIGATCFCLGVNFVHSTEFPDSYLTGNDETQRFSEFERGGLVTYEIVPLKSVESYGSRRLKRQVVSSPSPTLEQQQQQKNSENAKSSGTIIKKPIESGTKNVSSVTNNKGTVDSTTITTTNLNSTTATGSTSTNLTSSSAPLPNTNGNNATSSASNNSNVVGNSSSSQVPITNNATTDNMENPTYPNYPLFPNSETKWDEKNSTDKLQIRNDTHTYYNSSTISNGSMYWVDLESHSETQEHEMLSHAHRRAATLKLKFPFPFYGHIIENVTVATGGFIYLGEHVHAWLAATQYVAVLMANFDSSLENASVLFLSTDSQFTVQWHEVHLKDSPKTGPFTFQTTLYKNGTIVFVYKFLPIKISAIDDQSHPVKVGLSDAYIRDKHVLFVKQKTIYEYDRVDLKQDGVNIGNWTAIIFTPVPTCLNYKTCHDCSHHETKFDCSWCPASGRCSDGTDRYRDDWLFKECEKDGNHIKKDEDCIAHSGTYTITNTTSPSTSATSSSHAASSKIDHVAKTPVPNSGGGMSAFGVISVLFLTVLIVSAVGWVFYAYVFPHSTSGQLLIRYRPSQWTFRRNSVRYSAASIHM